jgi:phosphate starvation-inducible PhoH-like protein
MYKNSNYDRTQSIHSRKNKLPITWDFYEDDTQDNYFHNENKRKGIHELFKPRTNSQKQYYEDIQNDNIQLVIVNGPAGTGKTLFPTQHAAKLLLETEQKIVITRPLICVDEELGYLPGGINKKMDPWIIPIFDVFREFFSQKVIDSFITQKRIEIVPLAFMRGRTFKNTFIIGDELQNTSINQMLMLLTRIGENSKIIVTGDVSQCDNHENGLLDLISRIENTYQRKENEYFQQNMEIDMMSLIEMEKCDVQRSEIVSKILTIYENN